MTESVMRKSKLLLIELNQITDKWRNELVDEIVELLPYFKYKYKIINSMDNMSYIHNRMKVSL
jgi:hypothetical protein